VANQGAYRDILAAMETGKGEARLVLGGKPFDREGYYLEPTLFDGARGEGFLGQTEIFGPVTAFIEVDSFEQALTVANGTNFGLTGAVYSQAIERLDRAKQDFHVGNLYLNRGCTGALVGVHPFGGFNLSGTDSKAGGPDYLLNFTQGKTTSERVTVVRAPGIGV
jgi:1-pyrroline-5-carboxylate dehydrogenase